MITSRLCSEPGCANRAAYRGKCATHARARERHRNSHRPLARKVYNSAKWRNTREKFLHQNPLCQCGVIAEHVHHITDIEDGGQPFAFHNLAALCQRCHSRETRSRQAA